jgi:hypothetical protein
VRHGIAIALLATALVAAQSPDVAWTTWTAQQAQEIATSTYAQGRVGPLLGMRLLKTERAHNYKLAATWLTPDVIRATARSLQITDRLSDDSTLALVAEAEHTGHTVVMVELDPNEGSGVIPQDWAAFLQVPAPEGSTMRAVRGKDTPSLRTVKALGGVKRRNYDYDRFWVVFPLQHEDGRPLFGSQDTMAELVVKVYEREGRVRWPIPTTLRRSAS